MKVHWKQITALVKKDVIVKKRQPWLTFLQFFWPVGIFVTMYILRQRFNSWEQPACHFLTRQLPSNDVLPFFQSYICSLENQCTDLDKFEEVQSWDNAPVTPILNIMQTILNEKDLYDGIVNLPESMDFFNLVIKFATNSQFKYIESNAFNFIKHLPETRKALGNFFDAKQLFSNNRIFSNLGKLLCARPFPRSHEIRFVNQFVYTKDYSGADQDEIDSMPTPYCKQLYIDVSRSNHGKITWNILKPIIQGKVIFGPVNEKTLGIIKHANGTFTEMNRILVFVRSLEKTIKELNEDEAFRRKLDSLLKLARSPFIKAAVGDAIDLDSIESVLSSVLNDTKVSETINIIGNAIECYSVDRFVPVSTEKELEDVAFELTKKKMFYAAVYFLNSDSGQNETTYKLRMATDNSPKTIENKNRFWFPGPEGVMALDLRYHRGFIQIQSQIDHSIMKYEIEQRTAKNESSTSNAEVSDDLDFDFDSFENTHGSNDEKTEQKPKTDDDGWGDDDDWITVSSPPTQKTSDEDEDLNKFDQDYFDNTKNNETSTESSTDPSIEETTTIINEETSRTKRQTDSILQLLSNGNGAAQNSNTKKTYYTKQMPYPKYIRDPYMKGIYLSQGIQLSFFFALIIHVASSVRQKIWFRESENLKLMNIMGMRSSSECISWFITSFIDLFIIFFLILCVLFSAEILQYSNLILIFIVFIIYGVSVITFCYMVSAFFSMATIGSVATVIIFLINFMPYIIIISLDAVLSNFFYFIVNLSSSTAFCYCWQYVLRVEMQQRPLTFSYLINEELAENDLLYGVSMMLFDAILYAIIGYFAYKSKGETQSSKICRKKLEKNTAAVIKGITKIYDGADPTKPYVKNISLSFRRDEIFCILGRNGAGKSTIMKVLSGQIEPTEGEVFLPLNYDNITGFRNPNEQIGICTQNNVLIPNLTVLEHLELYASMKMRKRKSKEIYRILFETKLNDYKNHKVYELSGGYKRRLCIAIAFLGSPDLVILDEPSNGIDLDAAKYIWNMITKFKKDRAVFIATHNLDEVQFLADRIAILKDGNCVFESQMDCLRDDLSSSFHISVETMNEQTDTLEDLFKSNAISYQLQNTSNGKKNLNATFKRKVDKDNLTFIQDLEKLQSKDQISGFKVSNKRLNDLFENVDSVNNHMESNNNDNNGSLKADHNNLTFIQSSIEQRDTNRNMHHDKSVIRQFKMLMWKRAKHYSRNYKLILNILVLPVIFEIIAVLFMKIRPPGNHDLAVTFNRTLYPNSVEFYSHENANNFSEVMYDNFRESCRSQKGDEGCKFFDSSKDAYKWTMDSFDEYVGKRYGGISINDTKYVAWYNNKGYHSMPLYLNLIHSEIIRNEIDDPNYNITTINHPLKLDSKELSISSILQQIADAGPSLIFLVAFSLILASFSIYIVNERINGEKHQQKLSGVSGILYWTVAFIWDFVTYCICVALCALVFELMNAPIYIVRENMLGACLLIIAFGFAMIPGVYILEKLFSEPSLAKMAIFCINVVFALSTTASILILDVLAETDNEADFKNYLNRIFLIFPQHALSDGLLELCKNYILANVFLRFNIHSFRDPVTSDLLRYHFTSLVTLGVVFTLINFILEYRGSIHKSLQYLNPQEGNVMNVKNVSRSYDSGKNYSIKNISFGIKNRECLGLIGPNGAGKSTILKILARRTQVFSGVMECDRELKVSFCPQTNILDPNLTVEEMIKFYATLRDIKNVDQAKDRILDKFLLRPYEKFLVKNLSGGNKRKLNVACATIERSGLIMLDEPTSDMDPLTRQMIYKSIYELQNEGCSIVLTSHSVAEIEHLCQNVVILTSGALKTAGPVEELTKRFGCQYSIGIFGNFSDDVNMENELQKLFNRNLSNFISFNSFMRFTIDLRNTKNSKKLLSETLEKLDQFTNERNLKYTVTAFTLEEIFESLISNTTVVISTQNYDNKGFISD